MKQKLILVASVLMLIIVVIFMLNDMLNKPETQSNPYEYKLDSFKEVAKDEYCYQETKRFKADIDQLSGIAIHNDDNIYICGKNKIIKYNNQLEKLNTFDFEGLGRNLAISDDGSDAHRLNLSRYKDIVELSSLVKYIDERNAGLYDDSPEKQAFFNKPKFEEPPFIIPSHKRRVNPEEFKEKTLLLKTPQNAYRLDILE